MTKDYALKLLGGNARNAAITMRKTDAAISQWKDPLTPTVEAQVMFAFSKLPKSVQRKNKAAAEALK